MPTVEASYKDICKLIGKRLGPKELEESMLFAKGEIESIEKDRLKIDIKDTNRPDLWSAEGVAREIRLRYTKEGVPKIELKSSGKRIIVDKNIEKIRPYVVSLIAKNVKITDEFIIQMVQLQEKVDTTFGRKRRETAIGMYDADKVVGDIKYFAADPKTEFTPLGFARPMTLKRILEVHPKGKEYAHLIEKHPRYPILMDSKDNVLSMTPIINSDYTGKVTSKTKNLIIEMTGFNLKRLKTALNVFAMALADRGASIETLDIYYPNNMKITTPDLTPKEAKINLDYVRKLIGLEPKDSEIYDLLQKSGYDIKQRGSTTTVLYPAYRQDIMHPADIAEDIIISYGYNKIEPKEVQATRGSQSRQTLFVDSISEIMIGLGLQEILSYTLTNKDSLFSRMNIKEKDVVEIENAISTNWCVFRNRLFPGLLEFFSKNKHVDYPQRIFEIGNVILLDNRSETKTKDVIKLSVAITDNVATYENISSLLNAFMSSLRIKFSLKPKKHSSFIEGRCAAIIVKGKEIGFIGEIHPKVLENWKLEKPVSAFEINLEKLSS